MVLTTIATDVGTQADPTDPTAQHAVALHARLTNRAPEFTTAEKTMLQEWLRRLAN
jgi:hypothetical protein